MRDEIAQELVDTLTDMARTVPADAIRSVFISPNEADRNMEPANVVDGLFAIARAIQRPDERTELHAIARSIDNLAEAIREVKHV